ncbi:hypothetical protein AZ78_4780 [Lysobacter capsici AZ78]|uniref:Uncharacterized protein n=1 Tax=Lysobacter capsici AZ78 TaxID=1444315 RepID=A0A108UDZ8_9GAMM|nr:hypothetical protein AZ78_4780 [Lysobacter capsici AZ78]
MVCRDESDDDACAGLANGVALPRHAPGPRTLTCPGGPRMRVESHVGGWRARPGAGRRRANRRHCAPRVPAPPTRRCRTRLSWPPWATCFRPMAAKC